MNPRDRAGEGRGDARFGDVGDVAVSVHVEVMELGAEGLAHVLGGARDFEKPAPGGGGADLEAVGHEPAAHSREDAVGDAEPRPKLLGRQPVLVGGRLRIVQIRDQGV